LPKGLKKCPIVEIILERISALETSRKPPIVQKYELSGAAFDPVALQVVGHRSAAANLSRRNTATLVRILGQHEIHQHGKPVRRGGNSTIILSESSDIESDDLVGLEFDLAGDAVLQNLLSHQIDSSLIVLWLDRIHPFFEESIT
jgi:hypothetical protein